MKQSFHSHFDRDLTRAGSAILREAVRRGLLSQHEAMIHDQQWAQFSVYAKESHEVDILELVNRKLVREYGKELYIQVYQGNLPQHCVTSLLDTVYSVMGFATDGRWKGVAANVGSRLGFPSHTRINVPQSLDRTKFEAAMMDIQALASEQLATLIRLVRYLGISLLEAFFFDAEDAHKDAEEENIFYVFSKNKHEHRIINISTPEQIVILEKAAAFQKLQGSSRATPAAWRTWKLKNLPAAQELLLSHGLNIDDCRAAYACELYRRLSGHHAPILGGKAPNDEDLEARNHVAYELGNLRTWETDAYVGARANLLKEAAATSC
ncbi:integrase [Pseudomonas sp.]|uniref:integrase n=1 Tax=Pseudomonas sp. TaxID=306 RepID=UPI0028ABBB89|nr:integrase [Pseudomonas sp.]